MDNQSLIDKKQKILTSGASGKTVFSFCVVSNVSQVLLAGHNTDCSLNTLLTLPSPQKSPVMIDTVKCKSVKVFPQQIVSGYVYFQKKVQVNVVNLYPLLLNVLMCPMAKPVSFVTTCESLCG